MFAKKRKYHKQWHPQFVSYLDRQDKRVETLSSTDLLECARAFCRENYAEFRPELFNDESIEVSKACWEVMKQLAAHYPLVAVQSLAVDFGKKNLLIMDEVTQGFDSQNRLREEVAVSMAGHAKADTWQVFDDLLVLKNGELVYHGAGEDIVEYFNDLGYQCGLSERVVQFLLNLAGEQKGRYRIMIPTGSKPDGSSHFVKNFAVLMKYADDTAMIAGGNTTASFQKSTANRHMRDTTSDTAEANINPKSGAPAVSVTEQAGSAPGESVKTEVFRSEEADGSIVTKTVRTTRRTVKSSTGALVTTIEVETTTETEFTDGRTSTTVATETREETEESNPTTTSASGATAITAVVDGQFHVKCTSSSHNATKKNKHSRKKDASAMVSHASVETDRAQNVRAAAAWGEEVGSVSVISASLNQHIQALAVHCGLRLAFEDLTCALQVHESSKESTDVVRGVTGYAESGTMTAVVGGGRASKSAFLSALAGEEAQNNGKVFYNGNEASALVRRRSTGYCWFGDEHAVWHGTTKVREALCLSAYLRQSNDMADSRTLEVVEACLELLGLTELADQYIDSCSTVETRLVAIGVELAFAPSVLLLDEPTSGLDEKGAQRVIHVLLQVARTGHTVVCSLGDLVSSTELYAFDRLLLLSSGGETLFHGETRLLVQYLEALPGVKKISDGKSVTAWALESVGEGITISHAATTSATTTTTRGGKTRTSTKKKKYAAGSMSTGSDTVDREKEVRFVQLFQRSETKRMLVTQMQRVGYLRPDSKDQHVSALITAYTSGNLSAYTASWRTQVTWLVRRVVLSYWRSLALTMTIRSGAKTSVVTSQWQHLGALGLLLVSFMWFLWIFIAARSTEYDTFDGVNQGVSLIAWSTLMIGATFALGAIAKASRGNARREHACWRREQAWHAYPAVVYHVSSFMVELLFVLVVTFVAALFTFTLFGFWSVAESGNYLLYWLTLATFALGQVYLGQWLVRLMPNGSIAAAAGAGINLLPLFTFVWRGSALGSLTWVLLPQRIALQTLQALVFGATCLEDEAASAESELPCRELRLIPTGERDYNDQQQLTVHSYAELEYGAERGSVASRLVMLAVFLVAFRFLVVVALQKRQTRV